MAVEGGYQQQTTARAGAAMPLASAASEGAAIGAGIEQFGDAVGGARLRAYQLQRQQQADQQAADFDHKFAVFRQAQDTAIRTARDGAAPGAAGHTEAVMKSTDAAKDALFDGITDDRVRRHAQAQFDGYATNVHDSEGTWENGRRIGKLVTDVGTANDVSANIVRQSHDPKAYTTELGQRYDAIEALQGVDADVKAKLRREAGQVVTVGYINGLNDSNPAAAKEAIDRGLFNDILTPEQLDQARRGSDIEIRRQEAAAAREAAVAKSQFTEQVATVEADAARGVVVMDKLPALIQQATATGDTSTASRLKGLLGDQGFARQYEQSTPLQREQRVAELAAAKHPSEAQQQELHWLREKGGALDSRFNADPAGYMIAAGHAAPPIGPGRVQWAAAMTRATGRPVPPLTGEEVTQFRAIAASGAGGQDQVLSDVLDHLPAGTSRADAARQIAPDDAVFQHMAQVERGYRATIRAGAEALKANRAILNPAKSKDIDAAYLTVDGNVTRALKEFSPKDRQAVLAVAQQWLAGKISHGEWGVDRGSIGKLYAEAVRVGLGGKTDAQGRSLGGLGDWNGHPVALPDGSTNASFASGVRAFLGKAVPTNPDGSAIPIAGIAPVMVGANTYRFEGPDGRIVTGKDRKPIVMTIAGSYR